ncbi:sensor histidine kinase [Phenylobacterium immobile]|uniref:sensor histidine kinase n=1 Tax=Phenylobacterium immobile TaxID=21 RepID=UPI000A86E0AC|nr:ATP-binding protein [Phenylobacterium immobile]
MARFFGSLLTRIALLLLAALVVEFVGASAINAWQRRQLISREQISLIVGHLAMAQHLANNSPPQARARIMADLGSPQLQLSWSPTTALPAQPTAELGYTRRAIIAATKQPGPADVRLRPRDRESRSGMMGALRLTDGSFLTFRAQPLYDTAPPRIPLLGLHLALVAAVMLAALISARAILQPLRNLARTADATGGPAGPGFQEEGPLEVRQLAVALSAMQGRLLKALDDHTESLVAVSHDLRTPIQRLRLRAALAPDGEWREAFAADLIDMERFINSVIGYMSRGEIEEPRLVDVAALAMTAADDAADAGSGAAVDYRGPDVLAIETQPLALKRALGNLVENACKHAGVVLIRLEREDDWVVLTVEDDGPGIPAARRDEAFLPFHRLNAGRSGVHAGAGLGLTIVQNIVADMGGRVRLSESSMGGLAAEIRIPAAA